MVRRLTDLISRAYKKLVLVCSHVGVGKRSRTLSALDNLINHVRNKSSFKAFHAFKHT